MSRPHSGVEHRFAVGFHDPSPVIRCQPRATVRSGMTKTQPKQGRGWTWKPSGSASADSLDNRPVWGNGDAWRTQTISTATATQSAAAARSNPDCSTWLPVGYGSGMDPTASTLRSTPVRGAHGHHAGLPNGPVRFPQRGLDDVTRLARRGRSLGGRAQGEGG